MIEKSISLIANYMWGKSIENIKNTLSEEQIKDFNMNDYYYLTMIYELKNPKLSDIADKLKVTKPAVSALAKRLAKNEMVIKIQSETDKRVYYLKLTEKALKIIEGDNELYHDIATILEEKLGDNEVEELLQYIIKNIKGGVR
ncbi:MULTISPECIES: MarR family transcriptional regulator [Clostridium]|uniref:MarR family transcriptional regulator n=1 Tax=Clostridium TaxID=1485 RepID=UPI000824E6DD|nr:MULTISPECIES: MarR family transcriptional regulator [Clostridium]PJI08409.1 MarR family transcriptional regulator [Clostridium sp. CT7]